MLRSGHSDAVLAVVSHPTSESIFITSSRVRLYNCLENVCMPNTVSATDNIHDYLRSSACKRLISICSNTYYNVTAHAHNSSVVSFTVLSHCT